MIIIKVILKNFLTGITSTFKKEFNTTIHPNTIHKILH